VSWGGYLDLGGCVYNELGLLGIGLPDGERGRVLKGGELIPDMRIFKNTKLFSTLRESGGGTTRTF